MTALAPKVDTRQRCQHGRFVPFAATATDSHFNENLLGYIG
jgi:hypothetical protein